MCLIAGRDKTFSHNCDDMCKPTLLRYRKDTIRERSIKHIEEYVNVMHRIRTIVRSENLMHGIGPGDFTPDHSEDHIKSLYNIAMLAYEVERLLPCIIRTVATEDQKIVKTKSNNGVVHADRWKNQCFWISIRDCLNHLKYVPPISLYDDVTEVLPTDDSENVRWSVKFLKSLAGSSAINDFEDMFDTHPHKDAATTVADKLQLHIRVYSTRDMQPNVQFPAIEDTVGKTPDQLKKQLHALVTRTPVHILHGHLHFQWIEQYLPGLIMKPNV